MNKITLTGLLSNVEKSHTINGVEWYKANITTHRDDGREDTIGLRFKPLCLPYKEGENISLVGNIRTYSHALENGKNKVDLYVFTYFDRPDDRLSNCVEMDGRICKIGELHDTGNDRRNICITLANNVITSGGKKLNSYIPCVAWNEVADKLANCSVNDVVKVKGELHSRSYRKYLDEAKTEYEIRVANEVVVSEVEVSDNNAI